MRILLIAMVLYLPACASRVPIAAGTPTPEETPEPTPPQGPALATVEDLGRHVFSALQSADRKAFESLMATDDELRFITQNYQVSQERVRIALYMKHSKSIERLITSFDTVRGLGEAHGVEWSEATFDSMEYEIGEQTGGLEGTDAKLVLAYGGEHFRVVLDDCMHIPRGWVLTDRMSWQGLHD